LAEEREARNDCDKNPRASTIAERLHRQRLF
jgi:hypothetical protein